MDLRDLWYFQRVAELGHVGKAAEQLGRTQPALSKSIRRLEDAVGAKLFERVGRSLRLTAMGEALLARAHHLRRYVDMTLRELGDFSRGEMGHVRVGSAATITEMLFPTIVGQLLKCAPGITIQLTTAMNNVLRKGLREDSLDLILSPLGEHENLDADEGFHSIPLVSDKVVVVARAGHPIFARPATLADMVQCKWVLPGPQVATRQWIDRAFTSRGMPPPQVQIETSSMALLPSAIAETDLLGFISARNLDPRRAGAALRAVDVEGATMRRRLGIIYHAERYLSPATQRLIEVAQKSSETLLWGDI